MRDAAAGRRGFRSEGVPTLTINGGLRPTRIELNREITPDFDAVVKTARD